MRVKAVIFDMDGVLIDSMGFHVRAWQETFRPMGLAISSQEVYAREGESWRKSTRDFLVMAGYKPTPALIARVFKKRTRIFKEIFKPRVFKGARSLLLFLKNKRGMSLGLVTATPRNDVKRMLSAEVIKLFDATVCGGDTKRGKPHPEPYLEILKRLKIKAQGAVVIENAPYGITSCKLAGIRCIAVATSLPMEYLKEADIVVDSLAKVKKILSSRIKVKG
jgi:beta-phosphoglucomutase